MDGIDSILGPTDVASVVRSLLALGIVLYMAGALLSCFAGYLLFRVQLAIGGLLAGAMLGAFLVGLLVPGAPVILMVIAAVVCALPLAYFGYRYYQILLAVQVFATVAMAFVVFVAGAGMATANISDNALPAAPVSAWVFGVLFGLCFAVLAYMFARHLVVISTGLWGGFVTTACVLALLALDGVYDPIGLIGSPAVAVWMLIAAGIAWLVLAAGGIAVQYRTAGWLKAKFGSDADDEKTPAATRPPHRSTPPARKCRPAVA